MTTTVKELIIATVKSIKEGRLGYKKVTVEFKIPKDIEMTDFEFAADLEAAYAQGFADGSAKS